MSQRHEHIQSSPLLSLPGELRNKIYLYVFEGATCFARASSAATVLVKYRDTDGKDIPHTLAFAHTCRQTRAEFGLLPFISARFCCNSVHDIVALGRALGPVQRAAIRDISVLLVKEHELKEFYQWNSLEERRDLGITGTSIWPRKMTWSVITGGIRAAFPELESLLLIVRDFDMRSVKLGPVETIVGNMSLTVR